MESIFGFLIIVVMVVAPVVGFMSGAKLGRREREHRRAIETSRNVCGCDHHLAFHDETGCHQADEYRNKCACATFIAKYGA